MALDAGLVGRRYPASPPYLIGLEQVRAFRAAIGESGDDGGAGDDGEARDDREARDDDEAGDDREAGGDGRTDGGGVDVPPTFAFVVAWRGLAPLLADPELEIRLERVVHGGQRLVIDRPLRVGDLLRATATVETVRLLGAASVVAARVDLDDDAGPVGSAWSTLVISA